MENMTRHVLALVVRYHRVRPKEAAICNDDKNPTISIARSRTLSRLVLSIALKSGWRYPANDWRCVLPFLGDQLAPFFQPLEKMRTRKDDNPRKLELQLPPPLFRDIRSQVSESMFAAARETPPMHVPFVRTKAESV
jgi:hypothetical protein